jgi:hypothetical protein
MKQACKHERRALVACALVACVLAGGEVRSAGAQDETKEAEATLPPQKVLPPGLYLFQTRTRDGTCNDAPRTGYVTSAVATLDGVPGARTMTLKLLNSKYWPTWTLTVTADNAIVGDAFMNGAKDDSAGSSHFELREKKGRFQGVGARSYNSADASKATRCTLNYDALLKPLS